MSYKRISSATTDIDITQLPLCSTPPMRIRKHTDTQPEAYLLALFLDRANRLPKEIDTAQRIVATTLSFFPAVYKVLPDIMALATTSEDLSRLLVTTHTLHQKYGYAIHNPLPFFRDHMTLGGVPFSDNAYAEVRKLLQRHIPVYCAQIVTLLHQDLRSLLPEDACRRFDDTSAIWIAGTLSDIGLKMYILTAEQKDPSGLSTPIKRSAAALKIDGVFYIFEMMSTRPLTHKEWFTDFCQLSAKDLFTEIPFNPDADKAIFAASRIQLAQVYDAKIGVLQH